MPPNNTPSHPQPLTPDARMGCTAPLQALVCSFTDQRIWQQRFAASEVPDEWPYGLHQLGTASLTVNSHHLSRPLSRRSVRARFGSARARRHAYYQYGINDLAITWDELSAVAALQQRVPALDYASGVIWATDHWERRKRKLRTVAMRRYLRQTTLLWCLSRPQTAALSEWLGNGAPRVAFVTFGIDPNFFLPQPYPESRPLILSAGNDPDRDWNTLFKAFDLLHTIRPDVDFLVHSGTPLAAPRYVRVVKHATHVQMRAAYRQAHVVVVAASKNLHVSGMTTALEAQASARPVVMTATAGTEDYVDDMRTGRLVPISDHRAMAEALLDLLRDQAQAALIGQLGRIKVVRTHTSAMMAAAIRQLITPGSPYV